jgi:hypothetical protein
MKEKLYTKEQIIKKYKGKFIDIYPHHFAQKDTNGNYVTLYEVRGVKKTIHENFNLPEDCF